MDVQLGRDKEEGWSPAWGSLGAHDLPSVLQVGAVGRTLRRGAQLAASFEFIAVMLSWREASEIPEEMGMGGLESGWG